MYHYNKNLWNSVWCLAFFLGFISSLQAKDYFLTIGGGYSPKGNQASIESNVLMYQRMLADLRPDLTQHDLYFADGADPARDVQFIDENRASRCPPAQRILTEIFGSHQSIGKNFRNHKIPKVTGPTEATAIKRRFRELSRELKDGDRLIIYVTAHGGEAESSSDDDYDYEYDYGERKWKATYSEEDKYVRQDNNFNSLLYLWNSETIEAKEFGRWLDHLNPKVSVVMIMVQCYSGGFSHTLFQRHDPELGLSPARRCGFFSQLHDRASAGCTANTNEADYQEYSTYFWAALGGKTRSGEPVEQPDYNQDGRISFSEAHTYTVIESDTIDIPLRTSDAVLRQFSRLGRLSSSESADDEASPVSRFFGVFGGGKAESVEGLTDAAGSLADLLPLASVEQQAILRQLPKKLGMAGQLTVEAVRLKLKQAESQLGIAQSKSQAASELRGNLISELREELYAIWPELNSGYSPTYAELTGERADEFTETVESLSTYQAWQAAHQRATSLAEELETAERTEARVQRLLHTIETIVLAKNLAQVAPTEIVDRYRELVALEEQTLGGAE